MREQKLPPARFGRLRFIRQNTPRRFDKRGRQLTVGIVSLFRWNYAPHGAEPDFGVAAVVISDRMISAGDVQYEPSQTKWANLTPKVCAVIAGEYDVHTQAIKDTTLQLKNRPEASPYDVALIYGRAIQAINLRRAEDRYLAPLGLNSDTFLAQQKDMAHITVDLLTSQMQSIPTDHSETLVVGLESHGASLYHVDGGGTVNCLDDVGFGAIGIGAWHAKSTMMQAGYVNTAVFAQALMISFAAKRAAEIAPGVGSSTDIGILTREGFTRLHPDTAAKAHVIYDEFSKERNDLVLRSIARFNEALAPPDVTNDGQERLGSNPQDYGSDAAPAPEAARENGGEAA